MGMHFVRGLACAASCLSAFAQAPAPPKLPFFLTSTCDGIFPTDFGKGLENELFAHTEGGFFLFRESGNRAVLTELHPPTPEALPSFSRMKYRLGSWWHRAENKIFKWDAKKKAWDVHLIAPGRFDQFEVLPGDDLLLINNQDPEGKEDRAWMEVSSGGGRPKKLYDWPSSLTFGHDGWEARAKRILKTVSVGEYTLLFSNLLGKLWVVDAGENNKVSLLDPPFLAGLPSTRVLEQYLPKVPRCVQILPVPGRAAILIWDEGSLFTAEEEAAYIKAMKAGEPRMARPQAWKATRLDLVSKEFQPVEVPNGMAPPFWSRDGYSLQPLSTFTAQPKPEPVKPKKTTAEKKK